MSRRTENRRRAQLEHCDPKVRNFIELVGGYRPYAWIGSDENGCAGTIDISELRKLLRGFTAWKPTRK